MMLSVYIRIRYIACRVGTYKRRTNEPISYSIVKVYCLQYNDQRKSPYFHIKCLNSTLLFSKDCVINMTRSQETPKPQQKKKKLPRNLFKVSSRILAYKSSRKSDPLSVFLYNRMHTLTGEIYRAILRFDGCTQKNSTFP